MAAADEGIPADILVIPGFLTDKRKICDIVLVEAIIHHVHATVILQSSESKAVENFLLTTGVSH